MSLISLTFGNNNANGNKFSMKPQMEVIQPWHSIKIQPGVENKLLVKKVCSFYKLSEKYIVGEIVSGVVGEGMLGSTNGKKFKILELNCKIKDSPIAKAGMTVGLLIEGIEESDIEKDTEILFEN